jgi:hypothetical protein
MQLLVEVAFIDLEASDIQRFSQDEVPVVACLLCRRTQSFHPICQLSEIGALPCPHAPTLLLDPVHCPVFLPAPLILLRGSPDRRHS